MLRKSRNIYGYYDLLILLIIIILLIFGTDSRAMDNHAIQPELWTNKVEIKNNIDRTFVKGDNHDLSQSIMKKDNTKYEIFYPIIDANKDKKAVFLYPNHEDNLNENNKNNISNTLIDKYAIHARGVVQIKNRRSPVLKSRKLGKKLLQRGSFINKTNHIRKRPTNFSGKR
ncbi:MAG: hypothetical protein ACOCXH_01120 [Cyclobacteriaceae bacterium]